MGKPITSFDPTGRYLAIAGTKRIKDITTNKVIVYDTIDQKIKEYDLESPLTTMVLVSEDVVCYKNSSSTTHKDGHDSDSSTYFASLEEGRIFSFKYTYRDEEGIGDAGNCTFILHGTIGGDVHFNWGWGAGDDGRTRGNKPRGNYKSVIPGFEIIFDNPPNNLTLKKDNKNILVVQHGWFPSKTASNGYKTQVHDNGNVEVIDPKGDLIKTIDYFV